MTAPRKPQDHKSKTADAPKNDVFDLDALEREEIPEPFVARYGGKEFTFADPAEVDYAEFTSLSMTPGGERRMLRLLLGEQFDDFMATPIKSWKMWALFKAWEEHYGLPGLGKADG